MKSGEDDKVVNVRYRPSYLPSTTGIGEGNKAQMELPLCLFGKYVEFDFGH